VHFVAFISQQGSICVRFVLDKVALGHFGFHLSLSFYHCSVFMFIYMLLFSEGQTGENWMFSSTTKLRGAGRKVI